MSSEYRDALELSIEDPHDGSRSTIRGYLRDLLLQLWEEQDSFSGKRPFGDSGWDYDLYWPLVQAGYVKGRIDEFNDLDLTREEEKQAKQYVFTLIDHVFKS